MTTFDTKIAIVLREDLQVWQKLNVTAFLMSGIVAAHPHIIGEDYRDCQGHLYHRLSRQPVIVLAADAATLNLAHVRTLERGVACALFIEEMFATGHDAANRAMFAQFSAQTAKVVGLAFIADKKVADKIVKGAKMHP